MGSMDSIKTCFSDEDVLFEIFKNDEGVSSTTVSLNSFTSPSESILHCIGLLKAGGSNVVKELRNSQLLSFNIGYDVSKDHWAYRSDCSPACIKECSDLGFGIGITLYPMDKHDYEEQN